MKYLVKCSCLFSRLPVLGLWLSVLICPPSFAASQIETLQRYSNLVATSIYDWNSPSGLANDEIANELDASGIHSDKTHLGVVFRHILASITAAETDGPRLPIVVHTPVVERDWEALKALDLHTYSANRAYYIFATSAGQANTRLERVQISIPKLRKLKYELLNSGNKTAIATASMWLAMELNVQMPLQAVSEINYALPYLGLANDARKLETLLDKVVAHKFLGQLYYELNINNRAYKHAKRVIALKDETAIEVDDYASIVNPLNKMERYDEGLATAIEAEALAIKNNNKVELILAKALRMSIHSNRQAQGDIEEVVKIAQSIQSLYSENTPVEPETYLTISKLMQLSLDGSEHAFKREIKKYREEVETRLAGKEFNTPESIHLHENLSLFYSLRGDFKTAFYHQKNAQRASIKNRITRFEDLRTIEQDPLSRDVEFIKLQKAKLSILQASSEQKHQRLTTLIFALLALILTAFVIILWRKQRRSTYYANTDPLTGALTRRAMLTALSKSLEEGKVSSIVLMDLDRFKYVNDTHGHLVGDEVLRFFCDTVHSAIRKSDKLCRYGGEEFLLLLDGASKSVAEKVLNQVRVSMKAKHTWKQTDKHFTVSFSAGLIELEGIQNIQTVIKQCDDLLYSAKRKGRDRHESQ
ncbi:GGDEF domain-containing protein [Alteromonas sp. A079]|uniref:GGDEF domain-containing protein n=1 Tax=Alteromonas sp. A079 TaxID=3410268 RepID=UPI003BA27765